MATTNSAFVSLTSPQLVGATVAAAGQVVALNESNAQQIVSGGTGVRVDGATSNLATAGYAKNGAATVALSGTTAKTLDLTNTAGVAASTAGDTSFASISKAVLRNLGPGSLTVAPGGSNPFDLNLGGTTPTLTIAAGAAHTLEFAGGKTVDSTHKTILITPAADTTFAIAAGGA